MIPNVLLVFVMGRQFFCDVGVAFLALFSLPVRPPLRFGCSISAVYGDFLLRIPLKLDA
jgi:hypothetical protein